MSVILLQLVTKTFDCSTVVNVAMSIITL